MVKFISEQGKQFEEITLGVVGVGQVGKRVAKMAQALGIRCLLNDPPRADTEIAFVQTELSQLLMQSDIVTFHTPLTRSGDYPSFHLLYIDNIHLVKPNALIINAARGGVIDESAMLVREDLSFIIDCWENEPYCNSELLKRSICATPHIAGHAIDAKYRGGQMVAQALADWLGVEYYAPSLVVDVSTLSDLNISDVGLSNIQQLAYVLMQFYDFSQDDHVLRSALSAELRDDFAKIFELYRREYPFRYEWHHFSIPDGLDTQIVSWLNALMD